MKAKIIFTGLLGLGLFFVSATHAQAYEVFGRVWTSTTTVKTPYAFTGNMPSNFISTLSTANQAWDSITGSTLKTGAVQYTPSTNTYANAAFTVSYQNLSAVLGVSYPGATVTWASSNSASVYFNSTWTWGASFNSATKQAHLRTVATHEFGHAYGLHEAASGSTDTNAELASVMHGNNTIKYIPNSDDRAGIAFLY